MKRSSFWGSNLRHPRRGALPVAGTRPRASLWSLTLVLCATHFRRDTPEEGGVSTAAALAVLRGHVHLGLENRSAAARCFKARRPWSTARELDTRTTARADVVSRNWLLTRRACSVVLWQAALSIDPLCYEAFDALSSGLMLTPGQEAATLAALHWTPGDGWLGALYSLQVAAHNPGADVPALLERLQAEAFATGVGECAAAALRESADVLAASAEWSLGRGDAAGAYAMTSALLERDPLRASALPAHLAAATTLGKRNELFARGHDLVQADPQSGVAWYAVGCYYAAAGQHNAARRFLAKCTAAAPGFAPGWLAYGHAFAAQDETDQALAAYRTAARLFPGAPSPLLWVGVEYGRAANWPLARQFLQAARDACPGDPVPYHELGCVALRAGEPDAARIAFEHALQRAPQPLSDTWEVRVRVRAPRPGRHSVCARCVSPHACGALF